MSIKPVRNTCATFLFVAHTSMSLLACDAGSDDSSDDEPLGDGGASGATSMAEDTSTASTSAPATSTPAGSTTDMPTTTNGGASGADGMPPTGGAGGDAPGGAGGTVNGGSGGQAGGQGGAAGSVAGGSGLGGGGLDGSDLGGSGGMPTPEWGIEARPENQTCVPPAARDQAAALLSETGCADPDDPTQPADTLLPYTVASPLWSDGAGKLRYIALPDDGVIRVKDCAAAPGGCDPLDPAYTPLDDGDWDVPDGSVLVKTFMLGDRLIETRLLVRIDEFNWWGYSYEWREDQSDADLLDANADGYLREIETASGTQTWHYPSRTHCLQCHTEAAGRVLGLETSQQNVDFTYPNGVTGNQIETLSRIGVFDPASEVRLRDGFPAPGDVAIDLEQRARSYLHANCANCHRPGGESAGIDLRYDAGFAAMGLCAVVPAHGDVGVPGALLLAPGDASQSVLSLRMHTLNVELRMPRIGTRVVDDEGVGVIDDWIASLTSCPE